LLILTYDGGNLVRDQPLFARQQNHLRPRANANRLGRAVAGIPLRHLGGTQLLDIVPVQRSVLRASAR
jgi:hypothetical protein